MKRFCASNAAEACGGVLCGANIELARPWRCDSREVAAGDGFVAISGAKTDGHLYIKEAANRGASLVLAEQRGLDAAGLNPRDFPDVSFIIAERGAEEALALAASAYLRYVAPKTLAITGSVGKTTTRGLAAAALAQKLKVHGARRSFNTIIGCALTILSMAEDTEALVLELGTNHFGEIAQLVKYFPPETAVITEIAPAHLEGFGTIEGVLRAKLEICESAKLKEIIYNYDNELLREAIFHNYENITKIGVGRKSGADLQIEKCSVTLKDKGPRTAVRCRMGDERIFLASALFGEQHAYNMCYAYMAAYGCGVSAEETTKAFAAMSQLGGRGLCLPTESGGWIIDESYNANPASMAAAIRNVRAAAESASLPKRAALGGMRELGESESEWHSAILDELSDFDSVLLLGGEWRSAVHSASKARICSTLHEMTLLALAECEKGGLFLVKGSNSYGLKDLVAALTARFSAPCL